MSGLSRTVIVSNCHRWSLLLPTFSITDCIERGDIVTHSTHYVSDDHLLRVHRLPCQEIVRLCDELHLHLEQRTRAHCCPTTHPAGPCCIKIGTLIGYMFIILDLMLCADEY